MAYETKRDSVPIRQRADRGFTDMQQANIFDYDFIDALGVTYEVIN